MSRAIGKIGKIVLSPISLVIGDKATSALLSIAAMIPGPQQPFVAAAAGAFNFFDRISQRPPPARGSVTQTIVLAEPPRPYMMGETYFGGVLRHRVGYGDTVKDVPNPNFLRVIAYSGVGPIEGFVQKQFNFEPISSHYTGFYDTDEQLGLRPEPSALVPPYGPAPGWDASSKLSGTAAIAWNHLFDREGEVYASGLPVIGVIAKGEKCYDPRLDSSQPGGSGSHVLGDETTYTYSDNPALHAGTYAFGRFEGTKKIFGIGIERDGIDWIAIAAWANDCETNNWTISGTIFEGGDQTGPGIKSANLDDICAAGGARWLMTGAVLSFDWHRPRVPLATFTDKDIKGDTSSIVLLQSHRDRVNAVRPKYRSPAHNWEMVTAEKISSATYLAEDTQEKAIVWPFNMVKGETQAGQLATYAMADGREIGPVSITLGVEWSFYRPGNTLLWDSEIAGDILQLVILSRTTDPVTLETTFVFKTDTDGKHPYALGETAVAPPTPIIGQTAEERDAAAAAARAPVTAAKRLVAKSVDFPFTGNDDSITISAFTGVLEDNTIVFFPSATVTSLLGGTRFAVFYDQSALAYLAVETPAEAEMADSDNVFIGYQYTSSGGVYPIAPTAPPGYGGGVSGHPTFREA